jgi:phenylacetate-coenzyme A ligase PaaK-like adenylate-forming protein
VTIELMILVGIVTHWTYRLRSRAGVLQIEIENYGDIQSSGGTTGNPAVVRPVSISE